MTKTYTLIMTEQECRILRYAINEVVRHKSNPALAMRDRLNDLQPDYQLSTGRKLTDAEIDWIKGGQIIDPKDKQE